MALTESQQIYEALKSSSAPLITFKKNADGDAIAASLALSQLLKKFDKEHEIACSDFELPRNFSFLPDSEKIKNNLDNLRKFILNFDIGQAELDRLDYQFHDNNLEITLEPKSGQLAANNMKNFQANYRHDLIITLDTPDLESLHTLYHDNSDFFYHTPIMNIDHSTDNEHFGHYNIVRVTATSISEIIYDLIQEIDANLLDESIATCLLTGMIYKTKSFKSTRVTPKSLNIASHLIATGAARDNIIKNIYQTKSVNVLKLWGRVLQRLETDEDQKIAWVQIPQTDFLETATTMADLSEMADEMISNIPTIQLTSFFFESGAGTKCLIKSESGLNLLQQLQDYHPSGNKELVELSLHDSRPEDIIFHLKKLVK